MCVVVGKDRAAENPIERIHKEALLVFCKRSVYLILPVALFFSRPGILVSQVEGPVTIKNASIRLTVNPSVGRVVDFGRIDGPNLMRITDQTVVTEAKPERNGYQGYGGDQLWPAQQAQWGGVRGSGGGWPPLAELDGPNWTIVDKSASHITIESPQTPLLGLVARRRFEISANEPTVVITNTFERVERPNEVAEIPVQIWSVTGITEPEFTLAEVSPDRAENDRYVALSSNPSGIVKDLGDSNALRIDNRAHGPGESIRAAAMKAGMYGDWLAAVYPDDIFLQRSKYDRKGLFPDKAATEIYSSQTSGAEYVELEVLSSAKLLGVGDKLTNTVRWDLLKRPAGDDAELVRHIASVPEPT